MIIQIITIIYFDKSLKIINGNQKRNRLFEKDVAAEVERDFVFHKPVYIKMIQHCLREKNIEACGLLSGKGRKAWTCWPMDNILHNQNAFEMDLRQITTVFQKIEQKGENLVGIYHSHPTTPPYPSPNDIANANYPNAVYTIVSLFNNKPEVRSFRIHNNQVFPIQQIID